ncbi:MAG: short-chain dehydrogenase [Comamonadaceae bacterium PBBC1]|nr:MAG: short-chain dehydrogenase [Comamonadaceae bacterium PBBC1]
MKKRIVIVGATSAIAQQCARLWGREAGVELTLIGRDEQRLGRVAADLTVRNPQCAVSCIQTDMLDPKIIERVVAVLFQSGRVDIVLIAQGALPQQADCQSDLQACADALVLNSLSPVLFAEAFAMHMLNAQHGTLALIGSVAGDRGRKSNYVYGAAKGLVERYAQGLQHRMAGTGVKLVLIKPGPTDTPMTAHLKAQGVKLAPVEKVAQQMVVAIQKGQPTVYAPGKWWLIMMIIKHLPAVIFNKLNI